MTNHLKTLALVLLAASLAVALWPDAPPTRAEGGRFAAQMPAFTLKDPADTEHAHDRLYAKGAVLIITIPNVKHGDYQSRWSKYLLKKEWPEQGPSLVMLEDLSQQKDFRDKALEGMKKSFKADKPPMLLIDPTGNVRRSFKVQNDETVVLIFDSKGALVHAEEEEPTQEAAQRVRKIVEGLK